MLHDFSHKKASKTPKDRRVITQKKDPPCFVATLTHRRCWWATGGRRAVGPASKAVEPAWTPTKRRPVARLSPLPIPCALPLARRSRVLRSVCSRFQNSEHQVTGFSLTELTSTLTLGGRYRWRPWLYLNDGRGACLWVAVAGRSGGVARPSPCLYHSLSVI